MQLISNVCSSHSFWSSYKYIIQYQFNIKVNFIVLFGYLCTSPQSFSSLNLGWLVAYFERVVQSLLDV